MARSGRRCPHPTGWRQTWLCLPRQASGAPTIGLTGWIYFGLIRRRQVSPERKGPRQAWSRLLWSRPDGAEAFLNPPAWAKIRGGGDMRGHAYSGPNRRTPSWLGTEGARGRPGLRLHPRSSWPSLYPDPKQTAERGLAACPLSIGLECMEAKTDFKTAVSIVCKT